MLLLLASLHDLLARSLHSSLGLIVSLETLVYCAQSIEWLMGQEVGIEGLEFLPTQGFSGQKCIRLRDLAPASIEATRFGV